MSVYRQLFQSMGLPIDEDELEMSSSAPKDDTEEEITNEDDDEEQMFRAPSSELPASPEPSIRNIVPQLAPQQRQAVDGSVTGYRSLFDPFIKKVEGYSEKAYNDHNGNPTIGHGLNLNDPTNQGLLKLHGYDPEQVKAGNQKIDENVADLVRNKTLETKEHQVRSVLGADIFDNLKPNEKAAVMSLGYQSLELLGPKMQEAVAGNDPTSAIREMILNSNPKQVPGVLSRRLQEAEMYADPVGFSTAMKSLLPEEKQQLLNMINQNHNEGQKQALLQKYGSFLDLRTPAGAFPKLNKLYRSGEGQ